MNLSTKKTVLMGTDASIDECIENGYLMVRHTPRGDCRFQFVRANPHPYGYVYVWNNLTDSEVMALIEHYRLKIQNDKGFREFVGHDGMKPYDENKKLNLHCMLTMADELDTWNGYLMGDCAGKSATKSEIKKMIGYYYTH